MPKIVFEGLFNGIPYQTYLYSVNGCLCVLWPIRGTKPADIAKAKSEARNKRDVVKFEIRYDRKPSDTFVLDGARR